MKNTPTKMIGTAVLALLMMSAFMQISVSAQENDKGGSKGLEGSWNVQVTARNCQTGDAIRTFPAMQTFMRGGTMMDWGSATAPSLRGIGQGVWSYDSGGSNTTAFQFFRFNADGTLAGRQIGRAQIELSQDGDGYTSTGTAQVLDVNGNVIANNCSSGVGTRFE